METVKFTMRMPKPLFEKLRRTALLAQLLAQFKRKLDNKPRTMGGIIIKALEEYLGIDKPK